MKYKVIYVSLLFVMLILLNVFSGCTNIVDSTNLVISSSNTNTGWTVQMGYYITVVFTIKNTGDHSAENIRLDIRAEDQSGTTEFDNNLIVVNSLAPGETIDKSVTIDYQMGDSFMKAYVNLIWNGGSNSYEYQWSLS